MGASRRGLDCLIIDRDLVRVIAYLPLAATGGCRKAERKRKSWIGDCLSGNRQRTGNEWVVITGDRVRATSEYSSPDGAARYEERFTCGRKARRQSHAELHHSWVERRADSNVRR